MKNQNSIIISVAIIGILGMMFVQSNNQKKVSAYTPEYNMRNPQAYRDAMTQGMNSLYPPTFPTGFTSPIPPTINSVVQSPFVDPTTLQPNARVYTNPTPSQPINLYQNIPQQNTMYSLNDQRTFDVNDDSLNQPDNTFLTNLLNNTINPLNMGGGTPVQCAEWEGDCYQDSENPDNFNCSLNCASFAGA